MAYSAPLRLKMIGALVIAVALPIAAQEPIRYGAEVPFTTYEAEDAVLGNGASTVRMTGFPSSTSTTPEQEASGRAYAQLTATGQYIDFPYVVDANTIVIRHCIPDAVNGGGITRTLDLYVNGEFRQALSLSSRNNWLYGSSGQANGQSNTPTSNPHVYWNEQRFFIVGDPLQEGDRVRLRKNSGNTAAFYRIDLIDLEMAPPPLDPPPAGTYVSVIDYGATPNDTTDDTAAIQAAINAGRQQNRTVWFPPGQYRQSAKFTSLVNVRIQGAGMWHTEILGIGTGDTLGFFVGNGTQVRDLYLASLTQTRRTLPGAHAFTSGGTGWIIEDVWMQHVSVGMWLAARNAVIRNCRVRMTYADGINIGRRSVNSIIENCHVRGAGDDGIAVLSDEGGGWDPSQNNTVRYNTVIGSWWGHNMDLGGGNNNVFEYNYLADPAWMGAMTVSSPAAYPQHPTVGGAFRHNMIVRGGGNNANQNRGALWLYAGSVTISDFVVADNIILDSIYHGIHLAGGQNQQATFERNIIINPGRHGIQIDSVVRGSGVYHDNIVINPGSNTQFNKSSTPYTWAGLGNSWQPNATPPSVEEAHINDGGDQRSMVNLITLDFNEPVILAPGAIVLRDLDGNLVPDIALEIANPANNFRTYSITFDGEEITAGSLPDGVYVLHIAADLVQNAGGIRMSAASGDWHLVLHRLFGDGNGDAVVDNLDLFAFRATLNNPNAYAWYWDYNGDDKIDNVDLFAFRSRLTTRLDY